MLSKLNSFAMTLAIGWVIYLSMMAAAKLWGADYVTSVAPEIVFAAQVGMWDQAISTFVGASVPAYLFGYLARKCTSPIIRRINVWLNEPVSKKPVDRSAVDHKQD